MPECLYSSDKQPEDKEKQAREDILLPYCEKQISHRDEFGVPSEHCSEI